MELPLTPSARPRRAPRRSGPRGGGTEALLYGAEALTGRRREPLATHLARGFAVPWDADFETVEALPGTRVTGRRLDFALGCGVLIPTSLRQRWVFSDHAQVCYDVDLSSPDGLRASLQDGRAGTSLLTGRRQGRASLRDGALITEALTGRASLRAGGAYGTSLLTDEPPCAGELPYTNGTSP